MAGNFSTHNKKDYLILDLVFLVYSDNKKL